MPHLVQAIMGDLEKTVPVGIYLRDLVNAHRYLVKLAALSLEQTKSIPLAHGWAASFKRLEIKFPDEPRPPYIDPTIKSANLIEVINQCATIERLIEALGWALGHLPYYRVLRCHPTTSSNKSQAEQTIPDNDLVLVSAGGNIARFEISDVVSSKTDGNRKEDKDLVSLGVKHKIGNKYLENPEWEANGRLFLVVSKEFAERLHKRSQQRSYYYEEHEWSEKTAIFEVHKKLS